MAETDESESTKFVHDIAQSTPPYSRQSVCYGYAPQSGLRAGSAELLGIRNLDV
jgi:hypothetical protein